MAELTVCKSIIIFAFIFVYALVFLIWLGILVKGVDELEQQVRQQEEIIKKLTKSK